MFSSRDKQMSAVKSCGFSHFDKYCNLAPASIIAVSCILGVNQVNPLHALKQDCALQSLQLGIEKSVKQLVCLSVHLYLNMYYLIYLVSPRYKGPYPQDP